MEKTKCDFPADPDAGGKGETLEQCTPIPCPGVDGISAEFIFALIPRLVAASYRPPELLSIFALGKSTLVKLLTIAKQSLGDEPNIVDVVVPANGQVHVLGDTHGDLHSLVEALRLTGLPSSENVLCFAGDYVDRGSWGVEILAILLALKMWQPKNVHLVRGNHETSGCVTRYGFEKEVLRKYDARTFQTFMKLFRELPCAALLRKLPRGEQELSTKSTTSSKKAKDKGGKKPNKQEQQMKSSRQSRSASRMEFWDTGPLPGERRILVVHGGLFRSWKTEKKGSMALGGLSDLADATRRVEDPFESVLEDVLWSDPQIEIDNVCPNTLRGAGILFGKGAVSAFFKRNYLNGLIRGHEGCDMRERRPGMTDMCAGFSMDIELVDGFVATIFSAAKYPPDNPRQNKGAFATMYGAGVVQQTIPRFTQFDKQDYPEEPILFYEPAEADVGATPRNSFS